MKGLLLTLTLLNAGDSATTHAALSIGARELNPIQHALVLDAAHGLETVALWQVAPKAEQQHPALTKAVVIGLIAWKGFVVAHNVNELRRQQQFNRRGSR